MARMSIYVPDSMKARMEDFGDVNWSGIAQAAFAIDLSNRSHSGVNDMDTVVERIRASKFSFEEGEKARAAKEAKDWVSKFADYSTFRKMAGIDLSNSIGGNAGHVNRVFGIETMDEEAWFFDVLTREWESDEYVENFVETVSELWDVVSPQL